MVRNHYSNKEELKENRKDYFGAMHNVSEMGDDLIWAQNSMPQNLMKIELEVPGML